MMTEDIQLHKYFIQNISYKFKVTLAMEIIKPQFSKMERNRAPLRI